MRNNIIHNYRPHQFGSPFKPVSLTKDDKVWLYDKKTNKMKAVKSPKGTTKFIITGNVYKPSHEFVLNINNTINFLDSLLTDIKDKIK